MEEEKIKLSGLHVLFNYQSSFVLCVIRCLKSGDGNCLILWIGLGSYLVDLVELGVWKPKQYQGAWVTCVSIKYLVDLSSSGLPFLVNLLSTRFKNILNVKFIAVIPMLQPRDKGTFFPKNVSSVVCLH